jgi:hypothetical protein
MNRNQMGQKRSFFQQRFSKPTKKIEEQKGLRR